MSHDLIVAITLGQRDLQVLAVDDRGLCRISPYRNRVGIFHRALLDGSLHPRLWVPKDLQQRVQEREDIDAVYQDGRVHLFGHLHQAFPLLRLARAADLGEKLTGEEDVLWLTPGLLWRELRTLEQEVGKGIVRLHKIIFFETDRGPDDLRSGKEPVAAVPLLSAWFQENLPSVPIEKVTCLKRGEQLTTVDHEGNKHSLAATAERIDSTWRLPPANVVRLHIAGGIPEISKVVEASAQFRFATVQARSPSEDVATKAAGEFGPRFTPVEILHARRRARDLVRHGQFQAAAVLAQDFDAVSTYPGNSWVLCLRAAARYFQGYMTDAWDLANILSSSRTGKMLLQFLNGSQPQAFHVGMRTEAALKAGDILAAASLTITFEDVAVYDAVDLTLRQDPAHSCVAWGDRTIEVEKLLVTPEDLRNLAYTHHAQAFEVENWLKQSSLWVAKPWQEETLRDAIATFGGRAQLADSLRALAGEMDRRTAKGNSPKNFRNIIIHSLPTQKEI